MEDKLSHFRKMLERDTRYPLDAYMFVHDALNFASQELNLGKETVAVEIDPTLDLEATEAERDMIAERHLTGQELCEAIRQYALNQFGYMAAVVLKTWGITETGNFGDIVYNMIEVGLMRKSPRDCRSHFDEVYDFEQVFDRDFQLNFSES